MMATLTFNELISDKQLYSTFKNQETTYVLNVSQDLIFLINASELPAKYASMSGC